MKQRWFLIAIAILGVSVLLAGCGGSGEEETASTESQTQTTTNGSGEYSESPQLAKLVQAGELPPVEERLPENPLVVEAGLLVRPDHMPEISVGKYGGTLTSVTANPELDWNLRDAAMENFLVSPAHSTSNTVGNIVESFEINDDNTVYTFTLRKGLKWSDGVEVTTEDVRFAWEDVMLNEALTPAMPSRYKTLNKPDGEVLQMEIIDDTTFSMTFDSSYGYYMIYMGTGALWGGYNELLKPSHILKPYHEDYAETADLEAKLSEAGLNADEWHRLFLQKDILWHENMRSEAADFPTLGPWVRVESPQDLMVMERNPYYYKVDTAGQQLPYIDRYESVIVAKAENIPLKIISGDVNFNRDLIAHDKVPLLKENEESGGYKVHTGLVYHNAPVAVFINYLNEDPVWREVVSQVEFRQAVNKAINYENIIDVMFLGLGKPNPWIEPDYDPDEAARILDEIGLDKKNADGYRLGPDGEVFEFFFEINESAADWEKISELITADLEGIGLRSPMRLIARELWLERRDAGQLYATLDWLDDVNWPILKDDYLPYQRAKWGMGWHNWLSTGGAQGEEPPDWMKKFYEMDATFKVERPDSPEALAAVDAFTEHIAATIPMFPIARDVVGPCIVPPDLQNIADTGYSSGTWFAAEQMYFD